MKNLKYKMPLLMLAVVITLASGMLFSYPTASTSLGEGFPFKGGVYCVCKNSPDGVCNEQTKGAECIHNVIAGGGKNATRAYLSLGGTVAPFSYFALSNISAIQAGDYNMTQETTATGLTRAIATVITNTGTGNWSLVKTWTAGAQALLINATAIFNQSAMGPALAGGTFTQVNLESGDTLTVNYTLWIA